MYGVTRSTSAFSIYYTRINGGGLYNFSPVSFETGRTPTADAGTNLNAGWTGTSHRVLFDENTGGFIDDYWTTMTPITPTVTFPGYEAFYGEDTYQMYLGFVALRKTGSNVKLVLLSNLNTPASATISSVDAPLVKTNSRFFMLRNSPYVYFNDETAVYKYNVLNVSTGVAPSTGTDRIISLTDMGYGSDARITDISMHRGERKMLIAVSKYGTDDAGMSDELKGDIVEINLETTPAQVLNKYPAVSGAKALVIYKYRTFARNDEKIVD
jgi:hypothetical protein